MHEPASVRGRPSLLGPVCLGLLPIVVFYALLFAEMRPVPMYDDYHAILKFALDLQTEHGLWDKLLFLVAAQHDEYKLIVEHLLVAADQAITGHVHFGFLITIANLMPLGIGLLFWANSFGAEPDLARRLLWFVPVLCLLFQFNYVENLDWAMCGLQTMPVVLFSIAALHFASRSAASAGPLSSVCIVLASLSSANGFLVAPLALLTFISARRLWPALTVFCSTLFALALYLYRYQHVMPLGFVETPWGNKGLFFVSFLGGAVENMHHQPVKDASVALGALLLLLFALVAFRWTRDGGSLFLPGVTLWCLLSAAAVTQRRSYLGVVMSLTGRYKIYSDLLLICAYLFCAIHLSRGEHGARAGRRLWAAGLAFSLLFAATADVAGFRYLVKRRERVAFGMRQYLANPETNSPEVSLGGEPFGGFEPEFSRRILTNALRAGIYRLPNIH